nr:DUF2147 domain-containing protein [Ideonella livida]
MALGTALVTPTWAQVPGPLSPVGLWKSIDDDSGQEKSLVRITEAGGVVSGRIERLLDPSVKPGAVCEKCSDERKGQPVVGLQILRNLRQDAGEPGIWTGGEVLDPANGKTYRTRLKPVDGGRKLELRGYIGPFYRTQTWLRVE